MEKTRELGTLNMSLVRELHEDLLRRIPMYRYAYEHGLTHLMITLQLRMAENGWQPHG